MAASPKDLSLPVCRAGDPFWLGEVTQALQPSVRLLSALSVLGYRPALSGQGALQGFHPRLPPAALLEPCARESGLETRARGGKALMQGILSCPTW